MSERPQDRLASAARELYAAFAHHTLPDVISYCTYCDDDAYEQALHAPLRELPEGIVDKYVADAFHHTGGKREFLHFLPRVLELFRAERVRLASAEVLARCIEQAEPATWSGRETNAFQDFLVAALVDEIAETAAAPWFESRFGEYVNLGLDLARLVAAWPATARGAHALAYLMVYDETFGRLAGLPRAEPGLARTHEALVGFLLDGAALAILRAGAPELEPGHAADVDLAISMLDALVAPAAPP
jgi:hypothetical protein